MTDISLPLTRFTAETYLQSLRGLVDRYEHEGEPIHYKKAATDVSETTCSSCLSYFNDIGLIKAEKQGVYTSPDEIVDYFTKSQKSQKKAVQQISSKLREDPVFKEISFHIDNDGIELNDLAEKTAGGLEIDEDDIPKVERAVKIFSELDILTINENNRVTLRTEGEDKQKPNEVEAGKNKEDSQDNPHVEEFRDPSKIEPEELDLPPAKGDPEALHQVCEQLKAGGKWSAEEISEETEFAKRTAQGHVRYGVELGFIDSSDNSYSPTQRGYDFGFESGLNEKTEKLFLDGVLESDIYISLLSRCLDYADEKEDSRSIKLSHCERELRTHFGFTEESEDTLKDAINTFLQTIEATGYGNYIVGRRGSETRIEFSENELEALQRFIGEQKPAGEPEADEEADEKEREDEPEQEEDPDQKNGLLKQPVTGENPKIGPPLRISSLRIQNFRNIQDSEEIRLEPITTFIGKNESGKTSTLEAINSFTEEGEYPDRDICNDLDYESKEDLPIISLTFEITEDIADEHYADDGLNEDFPVEYRVTKYADGHVEDETEWDITSPSPEIVYYNEYDLISDVLYFDEEKDENKDNSTFWNLLQIGDLTEEDITETTGRAHDQAIENAENEIENQLNDGWSQKDVQVKLSYSNGENCLRLYIQDEILDEERELTHPSQRSEGFQWFFSFYVNMLAETGGDSSTYKILLLDDPAVHLHPSGKQDWLESLEEIAQEEQVLYTSHSPYLIEKQYPSRIRTVEDSPNGTKINADIFDADTGTLEPLRNNLGIDLSASPFVSEGQLLVEGPSEYYILSAVGTYMDDVLDRGFIDWREISLMPVRGADDVVGKASWLESENLEYVILLDSDEEGRRVQERIQQHHQHIDDDRIQLLSRRPHDEDVVIEDVFDPEFYVAAANEFYAGLSEDFEPIPINKVEPNKWEVGREEYEGQRIDKILVGELERQDIAEELENDDGEIELAKRPIAEILSEKINKGDVESNDLDFFNEVLGNVNSRLNL